MDARTPADDRDATASRTIERAAAELSGKQRSIPGDFLEQLFGRAVPEDVVHYGTSDLAMLGERAWNFLSERKAGEAKIRFDIVPLAASGDRKAISVLEIANDDMPFLFDSVMGELSERRLPVRLTAHPVLGVKRDANGRLLTLGAADADARESFIHVHIDPIENDAQRAEIVAALQTMLNEVRLAVEDWRPMRERVNEVITELTTTPPPLPVAEIAETIEFLRWLLADNFTFIGVRNYVFDGHDLQPDSRSGLGIMRSPDVRVLRRGQELLEITPEIMAFLKEPRPLIVAKANIHARVHRRVYLDYIGIKRFDDKGNLAGEFRIIGLFTSTAYTRSAHGIPYLRRKIANVEARAGFDPKSHFGKALANVLEHYPRDELFQIDEDTLYQFSVAIMQLDERPRVRVLARRDRFDRFVSIMVFVPRERYDSAIRLKIGEYLANAFLGRVSAFYPYFPEGPLVRVHYIIGRSGGATPAVERVTLEDAVADIIRTWTDGLSDALRLVYPPDKAHELFLRYRDAFTPGFQTVFSPVVTVGDIRIIESLNAERPLGVDFHHRHEENQREVGLKILSLARPLPLSERVPVLENMGFRVVDERTSHIEPKSAPGQDESKGVWFHDMLLERRDGGAIELDKGKARLEAAFLMVMRGAAENDGYNALTLAGGLGWRDVALIRALSRYLRQIRVPYSQDYMWTTLVKHYVIVDDIVALFYARFDPRPAAGEDRDVRQKEIVANIEQELQNVQSLDEDRILRHFVNAVQSAIRTDFFQTDKAGQPKAMLAIKFKSGEITDLPLPRPLYEIFVYSPRVEGVHLRFGKVARGGIRWSDRPQD
ncbi:MAG TPA: NAD-glutamate dehydrogenase domain-containing protein, partial [Stellaceae bacterium]